MTKKIIYIARNDSKTYPGVKNKIEQTVFALKKIGFDAEMQEIAPNPKHRSIVEFIKLVTKNSADVLILRSDILRWHRALAKYRIPNPAMAALVFAVARKHDVGPGQVDGTAGGQDGAQP